MKKIAEKRSVLGVVRKMEEKIKVKEIQKYKTEELKYEPVRQCAEFQGGERCFLDSVQGSIYCAYHRKLKHNQRHRIV